MQPRVIFSDEELTRFRASHGHYRDHWLPKKRVDGAQSSSLRQLSELSDTESYILLRVKAFFPFDFFPDEVIVNINRVNIIKRNFFLSERVHGIPIANVLDVFVEHGPLFAALKVIDSGFIENEISVNYLTREDAEEARELIQGLVDAKKQGIDLSRVNPSEVRKKLIECGSITLSSSH